MKTFWRSLVAALKITAILLLIIALVGIGILGWYFYETTFSKTPTENPLFDFIESLVPQRETKPTEPLIPYLPTTEPTTEPPTTEPPTTQPPEPEHVVSRATIGATGDLLMHKPIIDAAWTGSGYNFDSVFKYLSEYSQAADWAVANLETTLAGSGRAYTGYPNFNCPDEIVDGAKNAGFDMLLTGNNHSYDTGEAGFFRTIETVRGKGVETLGTMLTGEEPKFAIQNINGINLGLISYTYEGRPEGAAAGRVYLNGIMMHQGAEAVVNTFNPMNPEPFYTEFSGYLDEMRSQGAQAIVLFMHWGVEYTTTPVAHQTAIAQKLCDMGVDVIIGGHPHVVEPVQLLSSTIDPDHKTVCLYSMGNAVSNQRANVMTSQPSGHTEDGVWFTVTFCKYSDGTVYLEDVNLIPTWVNLQTTGGRYYYILPLDGDRKDDWQAQLELGDVSLAAATRSYDRTMAIVGDGLALAKQYLADEQENRDANYLAALYETMYAA